MRRMLHCISLIIILQETFLHLSMHQIPVYLPGICSHLCEIGAQSTGNRWNPKTLWRPGALLVQGSLFPGLISASGLTCLMGHVPRSRRGSSPPYNISVGGGGLGSRNIATFTWRSTLCLAYTLLPKLTRLLASYHGVGVADLIRRGPQQQYNTSCILNYWVIVSSRYLHK